MSGTGLPGQHLRIHSSIISGTKLSKVERSSFSGCHGTRSRSLLKVACISFPGPISSTSPKPAALRTLPPSTSSAFSKRGTTSPVSHNRPSTSTSFCPQRQGHLLRSRLSRHLNNVERWFPLQSSTSPPKSVYPLLLRSRSQYLLDRHRRRPQQSRMRRSRFNNRAFRARQSKKPPNPYLHPPLPRLRTLLSTFFPRPSTRSKSVESSDTSVADSRSPTTPLRVRPNSGLVRSPPPLLPQRWSSEVRQCFAPLPRRPRHDSSAEQSPC